MSLLDIIDEKSAVRVVVTNEMHQKAAQVGIKHQGMMEFERTDRVNVDTNLLWMHISKPFMTLILTSIRMKCVKRMASLCTRSASTWNVRQANY